MTNEYARALDYLLTLPDWERGVGSRPTRAQILLERPAALLDALGNPQTRYHSILIAGTKGKGSTAAMLESILRAAGYKTGLYTSPHLHTYRERIRVNGALISENDFARGVGAIQPLLAELVSTHSAFESFTTFEAMTALALRHFAREKIDVAILEVGLGGRLDATNVVDADLSLITQLSFDHTAVLGDSLPKIAFEKAGIIKQRKIVLTAPQPPDALAVIERAARAKDANLAVAERDWLWLGGQDDFMVAGAPRAGVWNDYWHYADLHMPLLGQHQFINAGLAVAAAKTWTESLKQELGATAARQGLAATQWFGRLEILQTRSAAQPFIVTDGAHNGAAMEKLAAALEMYFEFEKLYLIFGALRDKNLDELLAPLAFKVAHAWTLETRHPRSWSADALARALNARGIAADAASDMSAALTAARAVAAPRDLICLTGSLSIAALARAAFGLAYETDPPLI
ncbi:MAG: hypothetical protein B6D41_21865 [Chloroflexi bacterium UTCFX4]|jgi:dihydrofolate synthase/folylpolyglutamate synthase|nr:MAG: hypothetical protein B6D41_21865 [Chloroflexi bacterium UTCFX4]